MHVVPLMPMLRLCGASQRTKRGFSIHRYKKGAPTAMRVRRLGANVRIYSLRYSSRIRSSEGVINEKEHLLGYRSEWLVDAMS